MVELCWWVLESVGSDCLQAAQSTLENGATPQKVAQSAKVPVASQPAIPAIAAMTVDSAPNLSSTCAAAQKKSELCEAAPIQLDVQRYNVPVIEPTFTPLTVPPQLLPQSRTDQAPRTGPTSGSQLYRQRQVALQSGQLYTRLPVESFADQWRTATRQPTYQDWMALLRREARATANGQGQNRLEVILGDSLGLWLPPDTLPRDRLWLNQSISGDTSAGILRRLNAFSATRPTVIHLMIGVNDLKNNVPEAEIVSNLRTIITRLQQQHPQARIVLYSVLPTRRDDISNGRVQSLNGHIAYLASHHRIDHRDLQGLFGAQDGGLRTELTTDGLHLNQQGYSIWQQVIVAVARS